MLRDARNEHALGPEHSENLGQDEFVLIYVLENVERTHQFKRLREEGLSSIHLDKLDMVGVPLQSVEQTAAMELAPGDVGPRQSGPEGLEDEAGATTNLDSAGGCGGVAVN